MEDFRVPIFDTKIWENKNETDIWPKIECQDALEVYHNGNDQVRLIFGTFHYNVQLNEELKFHFDNKNRLSGITLFNTKNVSKLIEKLRS